MAPQEFDERELVARLEALSPECRVVFAAACAERALPGYDAFLVRTGRRRPAILRSNLTRLWDDLAGNRMMDGEIQTRIDTCLEMIPKEEEGAWVEPESALADDAAAAVAYALSCRQNGSAQEAAWAARRAYEALDYFVAHHEKIDWSAGDAKARALAMARILGHPLVQSELGRQRRDLDELVGLGPRDFREAAVRIQNRARADALTFFGSRSEGASLGTRPD